MYIQKKSNKNCKSILSRKWITLITMSLLLAMITQCKNESQNNKIISEKEEKKLINEKKYINRESMYVKNSKYKFSFNFASETHLEVWYKNLKHFKGRANIKYLEIGVFEGRSLLWFMEKILTHPTSRAIGIEIEPQKRLFQNIKKSGFKNRIKIIKGDSTKKLKNLPPDSFDFIYIDGSHMAKDVLADAVLSWELLKEDGVMIFDDYQHLVNTVPIDLRPKISVDTFLSSFSRNIEILHYGYIVIIKKIRDKCPIKINFSCSPIGDYVYVWKFYNFIDDYIDLRKGLYKKWNGSDNLNKFYKNKISLSRKEEKIIIQLLKSRKVENIKLKATTELTKNETFINLMKRLKLKEFTE